MRLCLSDLRELLQETPKGFPKKILVSLGWPWKKAEIEKALGDIRGYRELLTAIMTAETRELVADVPTVIHRKCISQAA